jgi:hypothetical protein
MHGLLSTLTAALLALHAVLGCCWHHAHRCTTACAAAESTDLHDGDHADCTDMPGSSHGPRQHGGCECQDGVCIFVGPTRVPLQELTTHFTALPALLATVGESSAPRWDDSPAPLAAELFAPSVRLHLACQVLLI